MGFWNLTEREPVAYTDDDRRWQDWVDRIHAAYADVVNLHYVRYVWKNLVKMLGEVEGVEHHTLVSDWLSYTYTTSLAVGLRRQSHKVKPGKRPLTLACVVAEMAKFPEVVTAKRYLASIDEGSQSRCALWFAAQAAEGKIGPEQATRDLDSLAVASEVVRSTSTSTWRTATARWTGLL